MAKRDTRSLITATPSVGPKAEKILELIRSGSFIPVFQAIVDLGTREPIGYEALTRGRHPELPESPEELFRIAGELGLEPELSRLCRSKAVTALPRLPASSLLFLNTHPQEAMADLVRAAAGLRAMDPRREIVLEIHEKALADSASLLRLRSDLRQHRVQIAFDDFGVGQPRYVQLAEAPPDYLKFDIALIHHIDRSAPSQRRMLRSLVTAAHDLGVKTIAEGVETAAEAEVCGEIGFTHAQGYFFGRPVPPERL